MAKKLEESKRQRKEIKNLDKDKKELAKKLEDSERQRADLEELNQLEPTYRADGAAM